MTDEKVFEIYWNEDFGEAKVIDLGASRLDFVCLGDLISDVEAKLEELKKIYDDGMAEAIKEAD